MNKKIQQFIAFGFGLVFIVSLLVIAILFPNPTPFQYIIFKSVLSLSAAGVAAMIPGFLQVTMSNWIRAGGALAVFLIVYFYNPASLVATPPSKKDSEIQLVDYSVSYPEDSEILIPEIDIKIRNTGDQVAFIKELRFEVIDEATYEDCRNPRYMLVEASAEYEIDILKAPRKAISHSVKPSDVDRIKVRVGRSKGGPTLTVYKTVLKVIYDEDNKTAISQPIFLKMVGPIVPAAMTLFPGSEEEWNECVRRNIKNFERIGYKIYKDQ